MGKVLLQEQTFDEFAERFPADMIGSVCGSRGHYDHSKPVTIGTVKSIGHSVPDLCVMDEAHNLSPTYVKLFEKLRMLNPAMRIIGFTATPYKAGSGLIYGPGKFFEGVTYTRPMTWFIENNYLVKPTMKMPGEVFDTKKLTIRGGDYTPESLATLVQEEKIRKQVEDALPRLKDRKKVAWACVNILHAEMLDRILKEYNETSVTLHSKLSKQDRIDAKKAYVEGDIRHITFVTILSEGWDYPAIDAIVFCRPTKSPTLYCLDSETEILTSHGWKGIGQVSTGDTVAAMDLETGKGKWSSVLNYIEREIEKDEFFVSYTGPLENFRVTNKHRMLFQRRTGRGWTIDKSITKDWEVATAEEIMKLKSAIAVPTAVEIEQPGMPLTESELYFIGMMMTDGTWTAFTANISQSERHPEILDRIEKCLDGCGFFWRKSRIVPGNSNMISRFPRWVYRVNAGKPKLDRAGTGFRHLMPYLDKDFSPALMSISKRQFIILLQAIDDGDGFKKKGVDYTPRSWTVCSARKLFVDRIQSLCAIHGMKSSLRVEKRDSKRNALGKSDLYVITVSPTKPAVTLSGYNDGRAKIKREEPLPGERVWCVETEHGTVVTRRKGKTTVMGNCQTIGRALRLSPDKSNALILDYGNVVANCGPIDDPNIFDAAKGKKKEDKPVKVCPVCDSIQALARRTCIDCDFEWPREEMEVTKNLTVKHREHALFKGATPAPLIEEVEVRPYITITIQKTSTGKDAAVITYHPKNMLRRPIKEWAVRDTWYFKEKFQKLGMPVAHWFDVYPKKMGIQDVGLKAIVLNVAGKFPEVMRVVR
jgi:superfamily II DNA or RNA helicase